ncbi:MAG: iron-containing alcohol dehydrogenase, partial [Halobacteriaceae archaeon]
MVDQDAYRFEYDTPILRYGQGCVANLSDELEKAGLERALIVCGSTVGDAPAVIDPVTKGLGNRLAGIYDQTSPEKRLTTAIRGANRMADEDVDVIIGLGGGSSLDIARVMSLIAARSDDPSTLGQELETTGTINVPETSLTPIITIPTTLAGADLSSVAGVSATVDEGLVSTDVSGGIGDRRLMPAASFHDPQLFATTPTSVLRGSAMNGFDKGVETLYTKNATPITDGTAMRGIQLLAD